MAQVADPDEWVRHEPGPCAGCGADLANAPEVAVQRRQVFDLPPLRVQVRKHQLITRRCRRGVSTCGAAPEGVIAPVAYGPRITAIILYLYVGQFLSKKRATAALAELFNTPVSVATMSERAAGGLKDFLSQVADRVAEAEVAGSTRPGCEWPGGCAGCTAVTQGGSTPAVSSSVSKPIPSWGLVSNTMSSPTPARALRSGSVVHSWGRWRRAPT